MCHARCGSGVEHHAGQHFLFAHRVGHGHHGRLVHQRVGEQERLDLGGGNVLARAADDVLAPVHEAQHAAGIARDDVAGVKPAAAPRGLGGLGVVQVTAEEVLARRGRRMAHPHLAGLAVGHLGARFVHHAHLQAGLGAAKGARADLARRVVVGDDAHDLGHAPQLHQGQAKALFEYGVQLRLDTGAVAKAHAVRALQRAGRLGQQHGHHHAQVMHDGGPALAHLLPPARGRKPVGLHLAAAGQQHAIERQDGRVHMEQRQRVVQPLLAFADGHHATPARIPVAGRQLVAVRQHAALGLSGGA